MVTYEEYYKFVKMGLENLKNKIDESIDFTDQQIINLNNSNTPQVQDTKEVELKEVSKTNTTTKSKTK